MEDSACPYNQSAAPFGWVMEKGQYSNNYVFGEVGVSTAGGSPGSYVRPETINVGSFLSGRDDVLSKCQPPAPNPDELKTSPLRQPLIPNPNATTTPVRSQNTNQTVDLLPKYTREKKSAIDLSTIDYNRWQPQDIDPQDLRFIIEDMWAQRGGLDTQNYTKLAWAPGSYQYSEGACKTTLDPARACGEFCETVSGYPGTDILTGERKSVVATSFNKPRNEPNYPFKGPYSQDVVAVGADTCGPNHFFGDRYTKGSCPVPQNKMLEGVALSPTKFPLKI